MAPPAKRRKRNLVEESDPDEDDLPLTHKKHHNSLRNYLFSSPDPKPSSTAAAADSIPPSASPSPVRKSTRSATGNPSSSFSAATGLLTTRSKQGAKLATKSPSTSPEKPKGKKGKFEEKGKTADLLALFSKQAQRAQSNGTKKQEVATVEDIASDPISEEDDVGLHKTAASSIVGKNAQKRFKDGPQPGLSTAGAGQRFLKPPRPHAAAAADDDQRPWSERFAPVNLEELAVHKKKVADVRNWLEEVIGGRRRQRLLILKGAAGTGKTTVVQLLARELQCEVLEWRNPAGSLGATQGFASASAQFEEFMGRGGRFGQLDFDSDSPSAPSGPSRPSDEDRRKLILIEEFPNTFMRSSTALTSFRSTILQYLAANTPPLATFAQQPPPDPVTPLVMIISETLLTTTSASADSFTAHRLLGPEIMRHPSTCVIEFNAIAPTLMARALELIVQKESRKSGRRRTPGPLVLQRLGEIGDIRSAISSLEFLCLKGDDDADWGSKITFAKPKKGSKDGIALTKGEQDSLELISQRESTLGIFHAVGKVVYNKRDDAPFPSDSVEALAESMPDFLAHQARPKRSQVSVDALMDETGTDTHTFISALHENYPLSCERAGPSDPQSSLDYINGCIEYLSESDLLCPSWDIFFGGRGFVGGGSYGRDSGSHILRQDEMAFQVAVRGLLFSLPSPVKRQAAHGGRGSDTFKMFYPTSLKLWRSKEELEALIDLWAAKLLKSEGNGPGTSSPSGSASAPASSTAVKPANGAAAFRRSKASSSVGDWPTANKALNYTAAQLAKQQDQIRPDAGKEDRPSASPLLALGSAARAEMLLERLPYLAHMAHSARRRGSNTTFGMSLRDIDKVVSFHGIGASSTEEEQDDDERDDGAPTGGEAWATDRPTDERASPRKRKGLGAILRRGKQNAQRMSGATAAPADAGGGKDAGDELLGGSALSGPVMRLVLSDDDIEDD